jgi:hypothetical protein
MSTSRSRASSPGRGSQRTRSGIPTVGPWSRATDPNSNATEPGLSTATAADDHDHDHDHDGDPADDRIDYRPQPSDVAGKGTTR